jgi:hypothetical protein
VSKTIADMNLIGAARYEVVVAHDEHRARFRSITTWEKFQTAHWLRQHEIINAWSDAGMQEPRPAIDGNATLPHGVEFDSTGDVVVGLGEHNQPKRVSCKNCVELGAEAIRRLVDLKPEHDTIDREITRIAELLMVKP